MITTNPLYSYLTLLFFLLMNSCQVQTKSETVQDLKSPPPVVSKWQSTNLSDVDPYFVESSDITSVYGPSTITRNMIQDKNGDIWLATWNGIIKYDGQHFTNFTNKAGLRRYHTFSVFEDSNKHLWFGSIGAGVYRYDGKHFINITKKDGLADDTVECIMQDQQGHIWFGTAGGVSRYDGKNFHNFSFKDGLTNLDVHDIVEDSAGKIWVATTSGICFYNGSSFTPLNNEMGMPFKNIRTILAEPDGTVWFGGQNGLFRYDGQLTEKFMTNFVGYLYKDKKGNFWISANDENSTGQMSLSYFHEDDLLLPVRQPKINTVIRIKGMMFGILEDKNGDIWLGTLDGVCRYDGENFHYYADKKH